MIKKEVAEKLFKKDSSKQKVELSADDISKVANKLRGLDSDISKLDANADAVKRMFTQAQQDLENIRKVYLSNRAEFDSLQKTLNNAFRDLSRSAKEIGVDVTSIPVYKEYTKAIQDLRELSNSNQAAWDKVFKLS